LQEDDFILKKDYKIVKSVTAPYGKWPMTYGNAFFTDSRYLVDDIVDMIHKNIDNVLARHNLGEEEFEYTAQMAQLIKNMLGPNFIDQYALSVIGHLDDRTYSYIYDKDEFDYKISKVIRQISLGANLTTETPIIARMEAQNVVEFMLNNVLATVIFFICLLSFILIFSLMQTDVEERKYEFAVLRTLGLRNNSLITLITIQSLFFSVPGIILGFTLKVVLLYLTQLGIISMTKINLEVQIESRTVLLGVITGLFIPFLSNIAPIK
jgi:ABC-type antimicrobial peptide transport system permease subunit